MSGSGISWAICKSAPCSRQITTPAPHHSVFLQPDALHAAQPTASKHWRPTGTKYQNSWRHIYQYSVCNVVRTEHYSGLCTNSVRTACSAQAWVMRRLTARYLPRSRHRKTHVSIQCLVGILQRQRQTEDLCFRSSLHSHWFLFSRSSWLLRPLHFFGWETISQKLNLPKPYPTDTLATTYCIKLQS